MLIRKQQFVIGTECIIDIDGSRIGEKFTEHVIVQARPSSVIDTYHAHYITHEGYHLYRATQTTSLSRNAVFADGDAEADRLFATCRNKDTTIMLKAAGYSVWRKVYYIATRAAAENESALITFARPVYKLSMPSTMVDKTIKRELAMMEMHSRRL